MARAIALILVVACSEGPPASPSFHGTSLEPAGRRAPTLARRLRRLSNREYNNVCRDLLGDTSQPANQFVVDTFSNGYDNGSAGLAVQSDQVLGYQAAAEALAASALRERPERIVGGCNPSEQSDSACLEAMLSTFAPRAFRRPLTMTEEGRLRDVFWAESQNGMDFRRSVQTVLEVVLQSPQFLYREEIGPLDAPTYSGESIRLTSYEIASELSFLLTGSIPDAALWSAIGSGRFETSQDYRREATRLLTSPSAKAALRGFLHQWMATDRLPTISKDASLYPAFDASMSASMVSELDQFFDDVLWNGTGSLRELFTSNKSFIDSSLRTLYGMPSSSPGFQPVTLDARVRKGVLTRAGWLAAHSATDSSEPVARGVFLLQYIMCTPVTPPPANIPAIAKTTDPSAKHLTTRQRFDKHLSSAFCAGCHAQIDGIGFGFEEFDAIGAYREMENGQPVDDSGTVIADGEIDGAFRGVAELTEKLSGSRLLADCYAKQAYRYAMGQVESPDDDLGWLSRVSSVDTQMTATLLAIVDSPMFVVRTLE